MIKEIWRLSKMLFTSHPSDVYKLGHLKIIQMNHFPVKGYRYMMWCGFLIARDEKAKVIERFMNTSWGKTGYVHECGHAVQAESEHGDNWIRFYLSYAWQWLKGNPFCYPSRSAYYTNRYEVEAYAKENDPEYWRNYNRLNLRGKYTIKHAKKKFKELGSSRAWKEYIKTL